MSLRLIQPMNTVESTKTNLSNRKYSDFPPDRSERLSKV